MSTALTAINDSDSQLAVELATEISSVEEVMARHGLSKTQLRAKLANPVFRDMYKEAKRTWNSDLSVQERIRLKSQVLLEDSLLELYRIFHSTEVAPPSRLDAFKSLAKVAHADQPDRDSKDVGNRVQIQINIPDVRPVELEAVAHADMGDGLTLENTADG